MMRLNYFKDLIVCDLSNRHFGQSCDRAKSTANVKMNHIYLNLKKKKKLHLPEAKKYVRPLCILHLRNIPYI